MKKKHFAALVNWCWCQFRRLPAFLQWIIGAMSLGSIAMSVLVGDIGVAAMGTAIGLSGALVGAGIGAVLAICSWAVSIAVGAKQR